MSMFKKLAIATAITSFSFSAHALQSLDDAQLSNTTAQDGLQIKIEPGESGISIDQLLIHDNNGMAGGQTFTVFNESGAESAQDLGGTGTAGAIVVKGLQIAKKENSSDNYITVDLDTDAGADTQGAFINANVLMKGTTVIELDGVSVGKSGVANTAPYNGNNVRGVQTNGQSDILGGLSLEITDAKMNAQLGAQPQGAMVLVDATLTDGLKINNLEVIDSNGQGASAAKGGLLVSEVKLTDTGSTDLTLRQKIDIDGNKGLVIGMGSPAAGFYGYMTDVGFSNGEGVMQKVIGDVEIIGLNMGSSTISINGKN